MIATTRIKSTLAFMALAVFSATTPVLADDDKDFGDFVEQLLASRSEKLFGFGKPLQESAALTVALTTRPIRPLGHRRYWRAACM